MVSDESSLVRLQTINRKYEIKQPKPTVKDKEAYLEYMTKKHEWFNSKFFFLKEVYQAKL